MNRRRRLPQSESLTPLAYRCPACCITARMQVVWPSWVCQVCKEKLVPADLHPRPSDSLVGRPARDETDIVIEMSGGEIDFPADQPEQPERKTSG